MRKIIRAAPVSEDGRLVLDEIRDPNLLATYLLSIHTKQEQNDYGSFLRISALAEGCVRERVLGYLYKKKLKKEYWSPQRQSTFDLGKAFHWWLQNDPEDSYFGPRRIGYWRCVVCGRRKFGGPPKTKCKQCGAGPQALFYHENHLRSISPRASGHVDMYLRLQEDSSIIRIVDFKSIPQKDFMELNEVRGKDAVQVVGYMILSEQNSRVPETFHVDTQRGFIAYLSKQHVAKGLPIKIFHVFRNKVWESTVLSLFDKFTAGVIERKIPLPLEECIASNWEGTRAKYCPAVGVCKIEKGGL